MTKIIPLISTKGSVGKTVLVIHIAGYLADQGKKVLLIDADSQQSLSKFFDYDVDPGVVAHNGFGKWLTGQASFEQVVLHTANHSNIDIIINDDPEKYIVPKFLHSFGSAIFQFGALLAQIKAEGRYDYIFIDTEGTDGRDHDGRSIQNSALLTEPDFVLTVTKTKILYAMEVLRVLDVYNNALAEYRFIQKDCHPPLKFLINEHDRNLNMAREVLNELQRTFAQDERFAAATLLKTIVPFKRKFFEDEHHRNKTFMHRWRDDNRYDQLDTIIRKLCEEMFPELTKQGKGDVASNNMIQAEG